MALVHRDGEYQTVRRADAAPGENLLVPVFRNGQLLHKYDFAELIATSEREYPEHYYAAAVETAG